MPLDEDVTRLAKGKNLATVVTLMPSGAAAGSAHLDWHRRRARPRQYRAAAAEGPGTNPRITVLIRGDYSHDWAEVRGHVADTVTGEQARQHMRAEPRRKHGA